MAAGSRLYNSLPAGLRQRDIGLSGSSINAVAPHQARLLLGWVTVC